jgi:hypothetical protein
VFTDLTAFDFSFEYEFIVGFDLGDLFANDLDFFHELLHHLLLLGGGEVVEMQGFDFGIGAGLGET